MFARMKFINAKVYKIWMQNKNVAELERKSFVMLNYAICMNHFPIPNIWAVKKAA
jgi:hypothetical protein